MGLDCVALVMEMEETFGIVIDDLDAERIGTVGQAYRYILGKLKRKQSAPCPSAALFYRLRRALLDATVADRREIRPSSRIGDFLPARGRRAAWLGLADESGLTMPRLELTPGQSRLAMSVGLATGAAVFAAGVALEGLSAANLAPAVAVTAFSAGMGWAAAYQILRPFASTIPRGCETVRGTVETMLGRHGLARVGRHRPTARPRTWEPDEVWATLRELISEQLGIPRDLITEEKHFVHDLGAD